MAKEKISPGMQQYLDIKENYPDAFLLFRMGDFYELFYDDAVKAAQILEISLTSRNKNADNPIPMAGVPYHSAQAYIDVLVEMGYKVAIAEQMEDPKQAVGVVKREVVQVITQVQWLTALNLIVPTISWWPLTRLEVVLVFPIWMCQRVNFLRQSWMILVQFVVKFRTLRHVK